MHQSGIKVQGLMADYKKKGVLGSKDKTHNHGSSGSQSLLQKRIADLEYVVLASTKEDDYQ